jgi:O-antigen/teichoic acid export membrane protein
MLVQAGYFVLLSRLIGVTEYGVFAGAFALVNTVTPYTDLGSGMLFMRYVTKDRSLAKVYWGNALMATALSTVLFAAVFAFVGPYATGTHDSLLFLVLTLSNCFFLQTTLIASVVFQSFERLRETAALRVTANLSRVAVLVIMLFSLHRSNALGWSLGSMVASGCAAILAIAMVNREINGLAFHPKLLFSHMWEGLQYSTSASAMTLNNDLDKTILSHYGRYAENGVYSLGYRIIDFASTPAVSIMAAALPRMFHLSRSSMSEVRRLTFRLVGVAVGISLLIALGLRLIAPVIPKLVGRDFHAVVEVLRWLCWLPALRSVHSLAGSAITACGRQGLRTIGQVSAVVINVLLNLWWIPREGWTGAARSSLLCDGFLGVYNITVLLIVLRSARTTEVQDTLAAAG